jgi:hypothetical protein
MTSLESFWWGEFAIKFKEHTGEWQHMTAALSAWQVRHMGALQQEDKACGVYVCWNAYCMARYVTGDILDFGFISSYTAVALFHSSWSL